jgi:hypothetical protein
MVETSKQVSIFLENKPGRLSQVLSSLAKDKVNIVALTVMDSHDRSVLRVVVDDSERTKKSLRDLNLSPSESEVMVVELRNQPGALAHVCELLAGDHVNIEYCYCSAGGRNGKTMGIFKVSSTGRAMKALSGGGNSRKKQIRPVRQERIYHAPKK